MALWRKRAPNEKKYGPALNAFLVEHMLRYVELTPQNPFAGTLKAAVAQVRRKSGFPNMSDEIAHQMFNSYTRFEQLGLLAQAFNEVGHVPMVEYWRRVPNPLVVGGDAPERIETVSNHFRNVHRLTIHILSERFDLSDWGSAAT